MITSQRHYDNARRKARDHAEALVRAYRADPDFGPDAELEPLARAVEMRMEECGWGLLSELVRQTAPGRESMTDADTSRALVAAQVREIAARERRPRIAVAEPDDPFAGLTEADVAPLGARRYA